MDSLSAFAIVHQISQIKQKTNFNNDVVYLSNKILLYFFIDLNKILLH